MAVAQASLFDSIKTGNIDLLSGGINIGNNGLNDSQVKSIFGSMASMQSSNAQSEKEDTKQLNKVLMISGAMIVLIFLAIKLFTDKKS